MTFRQLDQCGSSCSASEDVGSVGGMCDIDILVVEDNPGDIWLLEEAFSHLRHDVLCITKGYEMLDILSQIRHREIVPPALVLLDLNLPEIDGFDILKKIKSTDGLRSIPVVIFSGSTNEEDIVRAYELGASAYLPKPTDVDEHLSTLEELSEFWLSSVDVPR